tara:strand:+ start:1652 stop:2338 length:687 start_codon:yes stop_codon:yes gene_type:complete
MYRLLIIVLIICVFLIGCASHPVINPHLPAPGKIKKGYAVSLENVAPYLWYRVGVNDKSELGIRVGMPIYGTGLDYSRVVYNKDNKWDMINFAWSLNPNSNFDFTYYKFKTKKADDGFLRSRWFGIRAMIIPNGITNGSSNRFGFLIGSQRNPRWGMEFGYFHDPTSIPFSDILNLKWDNSSNNLPERYKKKPIKDEMTGFPSEYSRLTGLTFSLFFDLDAPKKKTKK